MDRVLPVDNFKHLLKIMRLTICFLFLGFLISQASPGYSQETEFTLNFTSASIQDVLTKIESESSYRFIFDGYAKKVVDKKVRVSVDSQNLEEILTDILSDTQLSYRILDDQVVIYRDEEKVISTDSEKIVTEQNVQQKRKVSGTITDKNGEAIIGANIV